MVKEEVKVTFMAMEPSDALKDYFIEKASKHEETLKELESLEVILSQNVHNKGKAYDFQVEVNAKVPRSFIHVEEFGENMYALVDIVTDTLNRRIKRYTSKTHQWEGREPWKYIEADAIMSEFNVDDDTVDSYTNYVPKITMRKKLTDLRPMEEAEAIEAMELMGHKQILFKSKATGKYSMIYKRDAGGYCLVEPGDDSLDI